MLSSPSGRRSQQADSAVQRVQDVPQVKQGEHGDKTVYFPKHIVLKLAFTYW